MRAGICTTYFSSICAYIDIMLHCTVSSLVPHRYEYCRGSCGELPQKSPKLCFVVCCDSENKRWDVRINNYVVPTHFRSSSYTVYTHSHTDTVRVRHASLPAHHNAHNFALRMQRFSHVTITRFKCTVRPVSAVSRACGRDSHHSQHAPSSHTSKLHAHFSTITHIAHRVTRPSSSAASLLK